MPPNDRQSRRQESRYSLPYHYIPQYDDGDFSQTWTLKWGYEYLSYLRFVIARIEALPFQTLLDVGCGDGRLPAELRPRFPDKTLVGIDRSEAAIRFARAFCPDVEWICGDFCDAGALSRQFDLVTLIETLEHIPPDALPPFVERLHRLLADNGRLIVTVPTPNFPVPRKHYQHFDLDSLRCALQPHFAIQEHYFLNKNSFRVRMMERLLSNKTYALQSRKVLRFCYRLYEKHFLPAEAHNARRICAVLAPVKTG